MLLDLGGPGRHAVRADGSGWRVIERAPVPFVRPPSLLPIPWPEPGGSLDALRELFPALSLGSFRLLVGWMVGALRPTGPYPVLVLQGERGSGKSTLARAVKRLLDASRAPLRTLPRGERDLAIGATRGWIAAYDNLGPLPASVSDALCRVSTGGGLGTRKLFTDQDEVVLDYCRPLVLTGIEDVVTRPDLAERAIVVRLPPMPAGGRSDEGALLRRLEAVAPGVLGTLLDGVVAALAARDPPSGRLPRMADFARWVSGAERGLKWPVGTFLSVYEDYRAEADLETLEHHPVGLHVLDLPGLARSGRWEGTPTELWLALTRLAERAGPRPVGWPKAPNRLMGHIRAVAPLLRGLGVEVGTERTATSRVVIVTRTRDDGRDGSMTMDEGHATVRKDRPMTVVYDCDDTRAKGESHAY